jgi:1-pyrroline-5-carboxylate dehydrogenase
MNRVNKFKFIDRMCPNVLKEIKNFKKNVTEVPLFINGKEVYNQQSYTYEEQFCPYQKDKVVSRYTYASSSHIQSAIDGYQNSKKILDNITNNQLYDMFYKMVDLVEGKYKDKLLASTIVGQGKNLYQAEIDAISELADFLRFNVDYKMNLNSEKLIQTMDETNKQSWVPLKGFVASISPFNFTAIGGNLATAPILMGNPVIWKPSDYSMLSNYILLQIMLEANVPPEVINFVPSNPKLFMDHIKSSKDLGGLVFTGHSNTFDTILKDIYSNINHYNSYPRVVGETGGNNYHFVFPEYENISWLVEACIRGAFEYSGQKCSATNRIYIPESLYRQFMSLMTDKLDTLRIDNPEKDSIFTSAVIHKQSYDTLTNVIKENKKKVIYGGKHNDEVGYYISPTIFKIDNMYDPILNHEYFGPIVCLCVYPDDSLKESLSACASTGKYNLTGSIFTNKIEQMRLAEKYLLNSVGNLYINDKSTGSVVGQQPFGGFGKSGTNDKAGSKYFLTRLGNNRIIKINNVNSINIIDDINF